MKTNRPILWAIAAAFLAAGVAASGAAGDGLPVLGIDVGGAGVASQSGAIRYVTMPAGPNTIVARADTSTGSILASRLIRGRFTIPAVAYDGSASGLSADGRTLVLIQPRLGFPRAQTPLLVIETQQLRPRKLVRLHGDFSFDAISLRGRLLYLIQYTTPTNPQPVPRPRLRPRQRLAAAKADQGSTRTPNNGRTPAHPGNQRQRPLGLHSLRRCRQSTIRARPPAHHRQSTLHSSTPSTSSEAPISPGCTYDSDKRATR